MVEWTKGWVWPPGKHGTPLRINKAAWNSNRPWNYIIQHDLSVLMSLVAFAVPAYPHTTKQTITPPHLQSDTQLGSDSCCELNTTILYSQMLLAFVCLDFFFSPATHTYLKTMHFKSWWETDLQLLQFLSAFRLFFILAHEIRTLECWKSHVFPIPVN